MLGEADGLDDSVGVGTNGVGLGEGENVGVGDGEPKGCPSIQGPELPKELYKTAKTTPITRANITKNATKCPFSIKKQLYNHINMQTAKNNKK